jgi:hypothetical protein
MAGPFLSEFNPKSPFLRIHFYGKIGPPKDGFMLSGALIASTEVLPISSEIGGLLVIDQASCKTFLFARNGKGEDR